MLRRTLERGKMEEHKCLKLEKFKSLDKDCKNIKEDVAMLQEEMKQIQQNNAETRVYVKQIFDRLEDLKDLFKSAQKNNKEMQDDINNTWQPIVMELIKMIGTVAAVIAGIKFLG